MLSLRRLVGGEEVDLLTGRVIRRLSASGGVAPPLREGTRACVARWRTGEPAPTGLSERGRLAAGWERLLVGLASRED